MLLLPVFDILLTIFMPEAERRRILPSHVEPATPGDDVVVQNQVEGVDAVDPEALARARAAVGAEDSALEIGIDLPVTPEEEKVAPGYGAYVRRTWEYIRGYLLQDPLKSISQPDTVQTPGTKKVYSEEQLQNRQARRELFPIINSISEKLYTGEKVDVSVLIGKEIPVRTNTYRVKEFLGQGGMGVALVVENIKTQQECVMKVSHSFDRNAMQRDSGALEDVTKKPSIVDRLLGRIPPTVKKYKWSESQVGEIVDARRQIVEIASLYRLTRHGKDHTAIERGENDPIYPQLYDAQLIAHPDTPDVRLSIIVMERIVGNTLKNELNNQPGGTLDPETAVQVTRDLMASLDNVHKNGVLHLDLKPDNIIITPEKKVALIDFGLANLSPKSKDKPRPLYATPVPDTTENTGTDSYYILGEKVSPARDVYGLGRIMHDMVYGRDVARDIDKRIQHFQSLKPALQRIARVAEKLVTRDQKNRATLQQARALLDAELEKAVQ